MCLRRWLGDAQLSAETNIYNLDMGAFYTKFIRDIYDTQVFDNATLHADGALPDCAPFYGHGHTDSDPGWGIAGFNILAYVADYYGDTRIVERNYPGAKWYLESWITNHVNASLMPFCKLPMDVFLCWHTRVSPYLAAAACGWLTGCSYP